MEGSKDTEDVVDTLAAPPQGKKWTEKDGWNITL